jgi:hypothetical protein
MFMVEPMQQIKPVEQPMQAILLMVVQEARQL